MAKRFNLGFINIRINRVRTHVATINFLMLFSLFIDKHGWQLWYLAIPLMLVILSIIDHKKILPQELDHYYKVSPTFQELINDVKIIRKSMRREY